MSWSRKSTYKPKKRGYDEQCDNPFEPVVAHGDKQPQEWEPPTSSEDIRPGEEKKDEGASSAQVGNIFRRVKSTYRLGKEVMIKHVSIQLGLWLPTVISNLKNGSHQLQVKTLDLVKRKRMKEHLQWKVKGKERNASCGWVCLGVCMCVCVLVCLMHVEMPITEGKETAERDLKHYLRIDWKSEEHVVCSLGQSFTRINFPPLNK
nr:uncharacterized protein LOC116150708 isoform X1 [Camelus dromedarius]XP_031301078.1 uncharacterized protein LOC116150708 isoform X1 [Camelus dromedarius]